MRNTSEVRRLKHADEDRCAEYGLDARRVESIARRLSKAGDYG